MADALAVRTDFKLLHPLRVRWAEVDLQKIVFNPHYLMYVDTAIADYWRALALPYERTLAASGKELFIIAGGIYDSGAVKSIGVDKVAVPSATFKMIVVLDSKGAAPPFSRARAAGPSKASSTTETHTPRSSLPRRPARPLIWMYSPLVT